METSTENKRPNITSGNNFIAALSALGIGLLWGSWSATRDLNPFDNPLFVPAVPAVMALLALVLAIIFRKRNVPLMLLSRGVVILTAFCTLFSFISPLVGNAEQSALGTIALGAEGLVSAFVMYVFLAALIPQSFKTGAISIAVGYLIVNIYDGIFLATPDYIHLWQRPLALILVACLCVITVRHTQMPRSAQPADAASSLQEQSLHTTPTAKATLPPHTVEIITNPGLVTATTPVDEIDAHEVPATPWNAILLGAFATILLLIQGVYSQITGMGGAEGAHLFNMTAEIYVAALRIVVLVYCLFLARRLLAQWIALCAAIIWLIGIPLVAFLWGTDYWLIGSLSLNSGQYILLPVLAIYGVQLAQRYPQKRSCIVFFAIAVSYCCYISRMCVLLFAPHASTIDTQQLLIVSFWSLWLVAISLGLFLFFRQHVTETRWHTALEMSEVRASEALESVKAASGETIAAAIAEQSAPDPGLEKEIAFYRSFQIIADGAELTDREREVLNEALHGYSINNIAKHLNLSPQTIKTYLSRAYGRVGVTSKQAFLDLIDEEIAKLG